jgi:hypothetical protein
VARVAGNGGDAFAGTGPARDGRTTVMPDAGTALDGAAPAGVRRGAGPEAFAAGSVPVGGAADRGVSAADTVARTVGRGGDAFAPGASGARRDAGPDFGPEPVVEVWR